MANKTRNRRFDQNLQPVTANAFRCCEDIFNQLQNYENHFKIRKRARNKIENFFLLLYSDNFVPYPLDKLIALHHKNRRSLTFMVSAKSPGNILLDDAGIVMKYDNDRSNKELNYVEIGYMIAEKEEVLEVPGS